MFEFVITPVRKSIINKFWGHKGIPVMSQKFDPLLKNWILIFYFIYE